MASDKPGVFSGQQGDQAVWDDLYAIHDAALDKSRPSDEDAKIPGKLEAWAASVKADLRDQGWTDDQIDAVEHAKHIERGGYAAPPWTVEDLWRRVSEVQGNMQKVAGRKATEAAAAEEDRIRQGITGNIQKFLNSLDPNSPQTQAAYARADRLGKTRQNQMSSAAGLGSMGSGNLAGGLSAMGQAGIQGDLKAKYDLQRGGLQSQGLALMNQRDLGLKGLELGYTQMQNQQDEQAWAAKQNQGQGIGAAIGTGIGALGFLIPGAGAAIGPATMAGGGALGGALGGMAARGAASGPSYAPAPKWMGNKGSSGGSNGNTGY